MSASTPFYKVIIDDLTRQIQSGELPPGSRLPSTVELAAEYGVGRTTVRDAINRMLTAGTVRGQQGVGVFVPLPNQGGDDE